MRRTLSAAMIGLAMLVSSGAGAAPSPSPSPSATPSAAAESIKDATIAGPSSMLDTYAMSAGQAEGYAPGDRVRIVRGGASVGEARPPAPRSSSSMSAMTVRRSRGPTTPRVCPPSA